MAAEHETVDWQRSHSNKDPQGHILRNHGQCDHKYPGRRSRFSFTDHLQYVEDKGNCMLGLIFRKSTDIWDWMYTLFTFLVRSIFEWGKYHNMKVGIVVLTKNKFNSYTSF